MREDTIRRHSCSMRPTRGSSSLSPSDGTRFWMSEVSDATTTESVVGAAISNGRVPRSEWARARFTRGLPPTIR